MSNSNRGKYFRGRGKPYWLSKKKPQPGTSKTQLPPEEYFCELKADPNPFRGWKYYLPDEKFKEGSELVQKVKAAEAQLRKIGLDPLQVEEAGFVAVDWSALLGDLELRSAWPNLAEDFESSPKESLTYFNLALFQIISEDVDEGVSLPRVYVRLVNYEPVVPIRNLKAGLLGKLVSVRGTVIRVGSAKLEAISLGFRCSRCGGSTVVTQSDGKYKTPTSCPTGGCNSRSFLPLCSSPLTQSRNLQALKIQENIGDDQREGGRVPRTLEVDLTDDLVDTCIPGDTVTLTGIIKVRNSDEGKRSKAGNMFSLYLECVTVVNSKGQTGRPQAVGVEFTLKDYYAIQEIHNEPQPFRLLVNSVCPAVYGHEMVKAGLLLALVGGAGAGQGGGTRGDSHVLIVGDPGLGKSHMLHACAAIAPRGLTVTLSRESGGDYALEAGALVLANHGVCCIDEFDKMSSQHLALLEAMEQQSVSLAKGGVVCTLPARTGVLAAANPAQGHYNRAKSVTENLRMPQPLLSRFDLVFILLDRPNEALDSLLSEHVMALHCGKRKRPRGNSTLNSVFSSQNDHSQNPEIPLSRRLKLEQNEAIDFVPQALMRKYIAYVRKYIPQPKLSLEAAKALQEFYLKLRSEVTGPGAPPITTRQLESLIRLTQARAKVELREEANEQDAQDVIELMKWSMLDTYMTDSGSLDFSRSQNGSSMSKGSKVKRYIRALQCRSEQEGRTKFTVPELREVSKSVGLDTTDFYTFLNSLNTQGFLLQRGNNTYELIPT